MHRVTPLLVALLAAAAAVAAPWAGAAPGAPEPQPSRVAAYQPDRLVVTFLDGRVEVVALSPGSDVPDAARAWRSRSDVALAEPNWAFRAMGGPNDPSYAEQWGLHNTGQRVAGERAGASDVDIDAPEGWAAAYGDGRFPSSGGTVVGVIDTGVDLGHPDLDGKVVACASAIAGTGRVVDGSCADDNGHGTHVAGTIAAATANRRGVAGVAPDAALAVFKALNSDGIGYDSDIVAGIRWLRTVAGARVINMSFGDVSRTSVLEDELAAASAAGVLLVAAAGNEGDATANYPAHHPDVVSVSAVDSRGSRAAFSNCNADVEVAAPGATVVSTAQGGGYGANTGTSMAVPHVAGVAAVLMSRRGLDAEGARAALTAGVERDGRCNGVGIVNLARAMQAEVRAGAAPRRTPMPTPSSSPSSSPWLTIPSGLLGSPSPSPSPSRTASPRA